MILDLLHEVIDVHCWNHGTSFCSLFVLAFTQSIEGWTTEVIILYSWMPRCRNCVLRTGRSDVVRYLAVGFFSEAMSIEHDAYSRDFTCPQQKTVTTPLSTPQHQQHRQQQH